MKSPLLRASGFVVLMLAGVFVAWKIWLSTPSSEGTFNSISESLDRFEHEGVPEFSLARLDGGIFELGQFRNQVLVINFWASWCDPCVREFPSMVRLVRRLKGRVTLLAISNDEKRSEVEKFVRVMDVKDPNVIVLLDPERRVAGLYGTTKWPETYVVGAGLRLVRKVVGLENWDTADALEFLEKLSFRN